MKEVITLKKLFVGWLLALSLLVTGPLVLAKGDTLEDLEQRFENVKIKCIQMELEENGVDFNNTQSLDTLLTKVDELSNSGKLDKEVKKNIEKLKDADYVVVNDGKIYSSKYGYYGTVRKEKNISESEAEPNLLLTSDGQITIMSRDNPTPSEVHGGTSGAFSREQLEFAGFERITANITLPNVSGTTTDEQAWVYFGFDDVGYTNGIEGGFAYQRGSTTIPEHWHPFVRWGSNLYDYDNTEYYDRDTVRLRVRITDDSVDNVLVVVEGDTVLTVTKDFDNYETLSVKKVTSIAKNNFDGVTLNGKSMNCGFDNLRTTTIFDSYTDFYDYDLYSYWSGTKWYGTIDWPASMIDRDTDNIDINQ